MFNTSGMTDYQREQITRFIIGGMGILHFLIYSITFIVEYFILDSIEFVWIYWVLIADWIGALVGGFVFLFLKKNWGLYTLLCVMVIDFIILLIFGEENAILLLLFNIVVVVFGIQYLRYMKKKEEEAKKKKKKNRRKESLKLE